MKKELKIKKILLMILIIFAMILSNCATEKKSRSYNNLRGLMLLENTQLGRNKHFNSPKYHKTLRHNYKKITKKR